MVDFRAIIENLENIHFYDVVLPFLLVYVVIFAILEKSKIFSVNGNDDANKHVKNVNAIIAFVFGLFVVASLQTVLYIQDLITNVVLIIIFILVSLIAVGFIFGEDYKQLFMKKNGDSWEIKSWAAWIIGLFIIVVIAYIAGLWEFVGDFFGSSSFSEDDFWTILVFIGIGGVIYAITKGDSKDTSEK